ncbi:MAG TPA: S1/P1 nuclease, partial [Parvularculaceae bacterium]|nr:S1/P1 nuclease [Parvularculaceae bacterium]
QPLHAGNGTDRGGNDVKVTYMGQPTNLHAVWDSGLIDSENLSYTEWANWLEEKITKADRKAWSSVDPIVWAEESAAIRDKIYPGSANLGFQYRFDNIATVRRRLSQAGVRIADYLNDMFR